ncbi:sirohydrochlorin chelatase [Novipirellula galeiformis]|uniref:sirohydrochlorin chelatase n=1 Tax=Novipirellula galeiformis TaxID=2528004 RepID=UPI0018CEE950|nr:sirohydrochlorin chelatase [Novipirellula galeiformis]
MKSKQAVKSRQAVKPKQAVKTKQAAQDVKQVGVLLVGHGTRDEEGTKQFFQLSDKLSDEIPSMQIQPCLLEFQSPTIQDAWRCLVEQGVSEIRVAPLLLFAAGHAKQDIPDLVKTCHAKTPHIAYVHTRPISRHMAIVELVCGLLRQTRSGFTNPDHEISLLMVGRGSYDPCAQADMRVLSELVSYRLGLPHRSTAFYAMAKPGLQETLEQLAQRGGQILVHPHLLFDGRLFQAIQKTVTTVQRQFPDAEIRLSSYLGPDALVARAIAARIHEQAAPI